MAKYFKILLLFIFVTAPALDIAFLDNQESVDHFSESYHDTVDHDKDAAVDLHCICHVIHHGVSIDKVAALTISDMHFKKHQTTNLAVNGLNPKPGLHPPSTTLS
tara:strand:+ start:815 stop:1129 length:315 start_codon:yes stop_codon:yes gene_type:complete